MYRQFFFPLLFKFLRSKALDPRNTGCPPRHDPVLHSVCSLELRAISFLIKVQKNNNVLAKIIFNILLRSQTMSLYIDMKMFRFWICSSSLFFSRHVLDLDENLQRSESCEKFPLKLHLSIDPIQFSPLC